MIFGKKNIDRPVILDNMGENDITTAKELFDVLEYGETGKSMFDDSIVNYLKADTDRYILIYARIDFLNENDFVSRLGTLFQIYGNLYVLSSLLQKMDTTELDKGSSIDETFKGLYITKSYLPFLSYLYDFFENKEQWIDPVLYNQKFSIQTRTSYRDLLYTYISNVQTVLKNLISKIDNLMNSKNRDTSIYESFDEDIKNLMIYFSAFLSFTDVDIKKEDFGIMLSSLNDFDLNSEEGKDRPMINKILDKEISAFVRSGEMIERLLYLGLDDMYERVDVDQLNIGGEKI